MQKNHGKIGNLGAMTDAAYSNYRRSFPDHATVNGIIGGIFVVIVLLFSQLSFSVIWGAIPNFTGNQSATDGILLGIFVIIMLLIVSFFLAWQGAAAVAVCRNHGEDKSAIIKSALKSAWRAFTISIAQILIYLPALGGVIAAIIAVPAGGFGFILPAVIVAAYAIAILIRTVSFFATNIALAQGAHFLTPILRSAAVVKSKGFFKILVVTFFITTINLGFYALLLLALLAIFGQTPAALGSLAVIYNNPAPAVILLIAAYLPLAFFAPKLGVLARNLYNETTARLDSPRLASRSMATALDVVFIGTCFVAVFYAAALIFTGEGRNPFALSASGAITTLAAFFAVFVIYNVYFEVFEGGQTLGKRLFGLEVITDHGEPPNLIKSVVRNVFRIIDVVTFVVMIFSSKHQRVGDLMSLTRVEYLMEVEEDV